MSNQLNDGWVERYTDADESFDVFGTRTLEVVGVGVRNWTNWRRVAVDPAHEAEQREANEAGMFWLCDADQFKSLVADGDIQLN